MEAMTPLSTQPTVTMQLKKPPKWLKRKCGASFGFGGKLVTFETVIPPANQQQQVRPTSKVQLAKVITEPELVKRSEQLETSIHNHNMPEFCESKIVAATQTEDQEVWRFIRAGFGESPRVQYLDLLGYNPQQMVEKVRNLIMFYYYDVHSRVFFIDC